MSTKHGVYDVQFKALPDDEGEDQGRFEAIVSVVGNVDKVGDRVMDGAFANSLNDWKASGDPIPVVWSHQWGNPDAHIGSANPEDVVELPGVGLKAVATVDLEDPFSAKVYKLLKNRRVTKFSFAYDVIKERKAKDGANELIELRLLEFGPTLIAVNSDTELLSVKSELEEAAQVKAGRSISTKNADRLQKAVDLINEVLGSPGDPEDTTEEVKAQADEPKAIVPESRIELDAQIRAFERK